MALNWQFHHPDATLAILGLIPNWISEDNPNGIADQLDAGYKFGGFKQYPMKGFKLVGDYNNHVLSYPGDPLFKPIISLKLRDETFCYYGHGICAVFQPDHSFVAARID